MHVNNLDLFRSFFHQLYSKSALWMPDEASKPKQLSCPTMSIKFRIHHPYMDTISYLRIWNYHIGNWTPSTQDHISSYAPNDTKTKSRSQKSKVRHFYKYNLLWSWRSVHPSISMKIAVRFLLKMHLISQHMCTYYKYKDYTSTKPAL